MMRAAVWAISASSVQPGWDDGELVAAQPRHCVGGAHAGEQPLRHCAQQRIAGRVAERIVHLLEAVEVEA